MVSFGAIDDSSPSTGTTPVTPVAVIGMACRLPGGIDSPESLWEALLRGDDLVTEVPPDRWDGDEHYDPEPGVPGRSVSKWGAFLDDVAGFDADFFGISESEATAIDPQHRLLLETSWEALEHAGLSPVRLAGSRTGVYVALGHNDYQLLAADANALEGPYGFLGNGYCMASGRIAYALGLHGPGDCAYGVSQPARRRMRPCPGGRLGGGAGSAEVLRGVGGRHAVCDRALSCIRRRGGRVRGWRGLRRGVAETITGCAARW